MKREKKSREQIKQAILSSLNKKPLSIQKIGEEIKSNWATTSEVLEELIEGGEIRGVVSSEKVKLYQKITGDTYFNIPIDEIQRDKFKKIFLEVIKEYQQKGEIPNKTQLAKSVVYVINELNQEGERLPSMWYLYGMIPVMVADLRQDYSTDFNFKIKGFGKIVEKSVEKFIEKGGDEIQNIQYNGLNKELYKLKKEILEKLSLLEKNYEEVSSLLVDFLISLNPGEDIDMFSFAEEFSSLFESFKSLGKLDDEEIKRELLFCFNSMWGFVAINQAVESLVRYGYKKKELEDFYLGPMIESKRIIVKENLSNLNSIYLSLIPDKLSQSNLSKGAQETADLFVDWN